MYLDFSLKKFALILIVLAVMFAAIGMTLVEKTNYFGTTPYSYTIFLGFRYALDTIFYSIENALPRLYGAIAGNTINADSDSKPARGIPVLTYHRIVVDANDLNNVTIAKFRDQMQTLHKAGWQTVTLADFEAFMRGEKQLPEKSFMLTFDDGAKESFYPVDPILRALGYHGVMFVIAHSAEDAGTLGSVYYLSPPEIERMVKSGRWDIGSHSYDGHRPYPVDEISTSTGIFFADRLWNKEAGRLETPEEFKTRVQNDLSLAKSELENTYGIPVESFAFPLGNETGINGANNFPEGAGLTQQIASTIYKFGFLQLSEQTYTLDFPRTSTSTTQLADPFLVRRVHVDYDWDGARLLSILENGLPKQLPYEDDFSADKGWIQAWGVVDVGRNNFTLTGESESNASTFLDGSEFWDNYSLDAAVNWQKGDFFVMGDVVKSDTYDSCAFSPGRVRILMTRNGQVSEVGDVRDTRIQFGSNVRMGIRVHGSVIECTWNFESIAESPTRTFTGGVGFQMWDNVPGTSMQISSMIVRPYGTE